MTKKELVSITLDKLFNRFRESPECFELIYTPFASQTYGLDFTVMWKPKIQLAGDGEDLVDDPNNQGAVAIKLNESSGEIACYVYNKAPNSFCSSLADSVILIKMKFIKMRTIRKKIVKLKDLIVKRDEMNDHMKYLKKLSSVFPDVLDRHILED